MMIRFVLFTRTRSVPIVIHVTHAFAMEMVIRLIQDLALTLVNDTDVIKLER